MSENIQPQAGHEHHSIALAQPDTTPASAVGVLIAMLAIILAITSYMLWVYFEREAEALTHAVVLSKKNEALEKLRAIEKQELVEAAVLDRDAGVYRIPLDRGAALFIEEAQERRRRGLPQRIQAKAEAMAEPEDTGEVIDP